MKMEYFSPECKLICLASKDPVALITDFDNLLNGGGRGDYTTVSDGDIDIDLG